MEKRGVDPADCLLEETQAPPRRGSLELAEARALGVCNFGPKSIGRLHAQSTGWVTNQLAYHLLWRAVEFDITAACAESDLGILCYSPLQQGLLTGRFTNPAEVPAGRSRTRHFGNRQKMSRHETEGHEALTFATIDRLRSLAADLGHPMADVALAWLLQQRGVRSVIFGARSPEQVRRQYAGGFAHARCGHPRGPRSRYSRSQAGARTQRRPLGRQNTHHLNR